MGLEKLNALLVDDLFVALSEKSGRRFARLKESGIGAKLKQVDIYDVPMGSLLLKLDRYEQPKTLFKGERGERQRCDYVLLTKIENHRFMLFIEIKSSSLKKVEIERQFKGAECVIDYCDAALTRFHGENEMLRQFERRFVIFYKPRLSKQRTRTITTPHKNDTPKRARRYPAPQNPSLKLLVS